MSQHRKQRINSVVLKTFIAIVFLTISIRVVNAVLFDLGFYDGRFHIGFHNNPQLAFQTYFHNYRIGHPNATWEQFLDHDKYLRMLIKFHPHFFWGFTQFTWITTLFLLIILILRYLIKMNDQMPSWLKWFGSQRILFLVAGYEMIIMVVFWAFIFNLQDFINHPLSIIQSVNSIIVHAVLPLMLLTYFGIYTWNNRELTPLKLNLALVALIYPVSYFLYYGIIAVTWRDPYPVSNISDYFRNPPQGNNNQLKMFDTLRMLYIMPAIFASVYGYFLALTLFHNFVVKKRGQSVQKPRPLYGC